MVLVEINSTCPPSKLSLFTPLRYRNELEKLLVVTTTLWYDMIWYDVSDAFPMFQALRHDTCRWYTVITVAMFEHRNRKKCDLFFSKQRVSCRSCFHGAFISLDSNDLNAFHSRNHLKEYYEIFQLHTWTDYCFK